MTVVIDEMELVPAQDGGTGPEQAGGRAGTASPQETRQLVERAARIAADRARRLEVY